MGILERSLTVATHLTSSYAFQPPCILSYGDLLQLGFLGIRLGALMVTVEEAANLEDALANQYQSLIDD
jgi:hypothetical protein